jgi:murein DD-endopeptidase MepM/ murein hydrolase activator NlpD
MYDSRLGRWLSVDIAIKTGIQSEIRKLVERGQFSISPYAFARNIPTWFVDNDGNLEHPVKGVPAGRVRISSQFGWRKDPLNSSNLQGHGGVDYAVPEGTKVYAVGGGTVVRADYSKSYGNVVIIKHDNGTFSLYAHNSKLNVKVGQEVGEGENISLSGNTGNRTTGAHLHFEIIKGINLQFNSPNEPNSVYNNINKIDPKGKNIGGTTNQDFDKILDAQTDQIKQKDGVTIKDVENNR